MRERVDHLPRAGRTTDGGTTGTGTARYFLTVRQFRPVSRAIFDTLAPASGNARNRRTSSHRWSSKAPIAAASRLPDHDPASVTSTTHHATDKTSQLYTFTRT